MLERKFKINLPVFIGSFIIGLIYVYVATPKLKYIVKYPTPFNVGKIVYKDDGDNCYVYKMQKFSKCPNNNVKPQPLKDDYLQKV